MKHITMEYGQPCNYLELTEAEYKVLEGFLRGEGVRCRAITRYNGNVTIQAENPYETYSIIYSDRSGKEVKERALQAMTDEEIMRYKW